MVDLSTNTWVVILAVVLLALLIAVWMLRRPRERIRVETLDVLTPGAAPAQRNTLLTEAPPAVAAVTPPVGEIIGVVSAPLSSSPPAAETAEAKPVAQPEGDADDLTRLKGVGPKLSATLNGLGVTRYAQIAAWTEADVAEIDPKLGAFQGRIVRDNWIEQCRYLAAGDTTGFEGRFGKL
jgi:predicted flap endonuclease-1-like 5' DNA nuclease